MSKRLKATAKPALLVWARKSASFKLDQAAAKLGVEESDLSAWEAGDAQPTISQLRKLADLYKRPLAVMYLPEPPLTFQPMHDFRRLPDSGSRDYSPELALEMRLAHQRRELALELYEDEGSSPPRFTLGIPANTAAETAGGQLRDALGITLEAQGRWRDSRVAFHGWRGAMEDLGIFVFQATRVESGEASGFAFYADALPFVVVNRKDTWGRRVFSLLHELAHLMIHQSGVSDLESGGARAPRDQAVEVYCNQVAAAALMPKEAFLSEGIVAGHPAAPREWSDADIVALAANYGVSRESVVRRLLSFGRTTEAFYQRKRAEYAREYAATRARDKAKRGDKGIPRNMPLETVASAGRPLVRMLLNQYHSDRLSLAEISGYLGVKARHLPGIERTLGLA
ncbi:MAG: ImmA/IrrE family metallo-endopeptidase [Novosphingobium sp.]